MLGVVALAFAVSAEAGQCVASSGPHTVALVELYTAEACGGCPVANLWLSGLASRADVPDKVLPLAVDVELRDRPVRQRKLTLLQRLALTYAPQVLLQGREFRGWATPSFDDALARINAGPARARLSLEILAPQKDRFLVKVGAEIFHERELEDAALYLASYENRPERYVVLEWQGPVRFSGARLALERALALAPGTRAVNSGVVGFVQNRRTGEVLQALMLPSCA